MPDTKTDLAALTAQVRALSGDLDRRFEQAEARFEELSSLLEGSNGRIEQLQVGFQQLNGRLETLTTTRKQSISFVAALGGTWVGGNTTPGVTLPTTGPIVVATGSMPIVLPGLARIAVFRTSLRLSGFSIGDFDLSFFSTGTITLERTALGATVPEPVAQFSGNLNLLAGHATPIAGRELVDNDLFKYSISAVVRVPNIGNPPVPLPQGFMVLEPFKVDCVIS